ncbi:MAG: acetyl-CoA carboxylase biotin carboxyl carrier protein, partial [Nitriliruptorales bacterium]|nr:acetyl-CoA carboxylase biotin carboxyl carrier protein [Nitriliruptorales bacterium]
GAPPYVEVGSQVDPDTTMGLIEVMKVFTSVVAGVGGEVVRVLVGNDEFVEFCQPLFLIRPESPA